MNHQFVVMWDCYGLECVADYTEHQSAKVWATLKDEPYQSNFPNIMHLKMRAQCNSQRHYEIYVVEAVEGITADDIRSMFEADPQTAADTIRRLGHCCHSDRNPEHKILIR